MNFFKRLRLFDYLIIVVILLAIIILYRFFNPETKWVDIIVLDSKEPAFQVSFLHKGDYEKDSSGKNIAEIIGLEVYDAPDTPINPVVNKNVYIKVRILARFNNRNEELEYKNRIVKVGAPIELRFTYGLITGTIAGITDNRYKEEFQTKTISVVIYKQWPWYADTLKIGDGEVNPDGQKILELISKNVTPAEITIDTASGERVTRSDPQKEDVNLTLKVQLQKFGNKYLFKRDKDILIGERISFNVGSTAVQDAIITKIE